MGRRKNTIDPEKEKYWRSLFERFHKSGEPFRKFCEREGVSPNTFQYWRRELRKRDEERGSVSSIRKGDNRPSQERENLEYWGKIIQELQAYSGSVRSFCKKHGISSGNLHYWKTQLKKNSGMPPAKTRASTPNFVALEVVPDKVTNPELNLEPEAHQGNNFIELVVPSGCVIRIAQDSDFTLLSRLLSFMEARKC